MTLKSATGETINFSKKFERSIEKRLGGRFDIPCVAAVSKWSRRRIMAAFHEFEPSPTENPPCYGSPVVKVSDHGKHVMCSSPIPLKTHRVGQRSTLNLSRAETSSCLCDS
ncbi:hypothetical protein TNCV_965041 [Trichonephila clavipes]|nr:hypothetical protein TNCV_965041 [Trichonephila clavipes]